MSEAHSDLVSRAVRWLRNKHGCNCVYAEMVTRVSETPDAIGWRRSRSHVVEVKVSRSDFFADRRKPHMLHAAAGMGEQRWYLVPQGLIDASEVPEWCGLAYVDGRSVVVIKPAPLRERWDSRSETSLLISAIRRQVLGVPFDSRTCRWAPYAERIDEATLRALKEIQQGALTTGQGES